MGIALRHIEKACAQIVISGKVQGVGYCYTAQQIPNEYQLTGSVHNKIK